MDKTRWLTSAILYVHMFQSAISSQRGAILRDKRDVSHCFTWSPWINTNHPSLGHKSDEESVSSLVLDNECNRLYAGEITKIECKDEANTVYQNGTTSSKDGRFQVQCKLDEVALKCSVLDMSLQMCPDMSLRYFCYCDPILAGITFTTLFSTKASSSRTSSLYRVSMSPKSTSRSTHAITTSSTLLPRTFVTKTSTNKVAYQSTFTTSFSSRFDAGRGISTPRPLMSGLTASSPITFNQSNDVGNPTHTQISRSSYATDGIRIPWWILGVSVLGILCILGVLIALCLYVSCVLKPRLKSRKRSTVLPV